MKERNITISLEKAVEWYNSGNDSLKEVALQAFSTHRRTLMSERLIKTPIRYYFDNIMEMVKRREYGRNNLLWNK